MGDNLYNQGEQLQLNCMSEGGPALEYTWFLSGETIDNATIDNGNGTLVIDDVSTTDGGDYTCNVTNNAGYQSNNITVYSKSLLLCAVGLKMKSWGSIIFKVVRNSPEIFICSDVCA